MPKILFTLLILTLTVIPVRAADHKEGEGNIPGGRGRHIIVMIADGCGYNHVDAASLYQYGHTGAQIYERFPVKLAMSTYPYGGGYDSTAAWKDIDGVRDGTTDSAAAATAMSTGVKTYRGAIGVAVDRASLKHAMEWAEDRGMATGVVTTVEFSHATPAGFVAHNASRRHYAAIANEMIYDSALEVIMGAGAPDYDNNGDPDRLDTRYVGGPETFADLTDDGTAMGADADGDGRADAWQVIRARRDFQAMATGPTPRRVLGLPFVHETLQQRRSGNLNAAPYAVPRIASVPTLAEMARAALNVLDNDVEGFVLMIEGGAVDWAAHDNQSGRMIEEEIDFNHAVEAVVGWVAQNSDWEETLLIVTGDHETGYLNGPVAGGKSSTGKVLTNNGKGVLPGMEWYSKGHTNQLIPFFARGTAAHLFTHEIAGEDSLRGPYIDNTAIGRVLVGLLKK